MHLLGMLGAPGASFYCPTDPSLSHQHMRAKDSSSAKWDEGGQCQEVHANGGTPEGWGHMQ